MAHGSKSKPRIAMRDRQICIKRALSKLSKLSIQSHHTNGPTLAQDARREVSISTSPFTAAHNSAHGVPQSSSPLTTSLNAEDVIITIAVVAIQKKDSEVTPTAWISLEHDPIFGAKQCQNMRWLCTQALKQAGSLEIMMWMRNMGWQELKQHLMVYFPGFEWSCWVEPGEAVFDNWQEALLKRGHVKEFKMMLGVDEAKALEVTGVGKNTEAIKSSEEPGTETRLPTARRHLQDAMRMLVIEDEK